MGNFIAEIAIIKPLHNLFDYEIPNTFQFVTPGARVKVEFGKKLVTGFVINIKRETKLSNTKLKKIIEIIDNTPVLDEEILNLFKWVSNYYHAPLGQVIGLGTPSYLRNGKEIFDADYNTKNFKEDELENIFNLTKEQLIAANEISKSLTDFNCFLLDGVTGSGKTEVYKNIQSQITSKNLQTLIIVPEKNLIPGLLKSFKKLNLKVLEYHSSLTPKKKFDHWSLIQNCKVDVIIGTRSSVFLKIPNLGLIVVDEEHDVSLKNQSEAKYNARDIAIFRAKEKNIPIILGTATPSSETLVNVIKKKYKHIKMRKRINKKKMPSLQVIDISNSKKDILSHEVISSMESTLQKKEQVLIYLNRRGYSPVIFCNNCEWVPTCPNCGINMSYHKKNDYMLCHHCGKRIKHENKCQNCGSDDLSFIGEGTEKVEEYIKEKFINSRIVRIDSDNTRKKGELQKIFNDVLSNKYDILIGTQMLSKGHNFPNITLVVIINIDQSLFSPRLKALEQLAQQLIQVSGRSGRGEKPGEVMLQTSFPKNEDLKCLIENGYEAWMYNLLKTRENLNLPPYKNWGIIQAKAKKLVDAENFLMKVKKQIRTNGEIQLFGPMPSIMQKKAGFYNANLIIQANNKGSLNMVLKNCIPILKNIPYSNKIKWSFDIDPIDYE